MPGGAGSTSSGGSSLMSIVKSDGDFWKVQDRKYVMLFYTFALKKIVDNISKHRNISFNNQEIYKKPDSA